jgi:hypothetical protein
MTVDQEKLSDFQEITFWQQFNKQLINKKEQGESINKLKQRALQKFCFENMLFNKITEDPLFDEIPLAFISDFSKVNFITIKNSHWTDCVSLLISDVSFLDIEQALVDAFDVISDYDKKYKLFGTAAGEDDSDDDEDLYQFIDDYNTILEKQQRDVGVILNDLYQLKAEIVLKIVNNFNGKKFVSLDNNNVHLDFRQSIDKNDISLLYNKEYCKHAIARIENLASMTGVFQDMEILGLLDTKESEPKLKPSIREFIQHERQLIERQSKLMREFNGQLQSKLDSKSDYRIKILNRSPFAFLKSPFPEV